MTASLTASPSVPLPRVLALPETFCFADTNPLSGAPYAASCARDLPPWALREVPVTPEAWDALVVVGATSFVVDPEQPFSLANLAAAVVMCRRGTPPPNVCPDCWGTVLAVDTDGSMTGRVGVPFVCHCADGSLGGAL